MRRSNSAQRIHADEAPLPTACASADAARHCIISLLPDDVAVQAGVPGDCGGSLHPEEAACIAGAAPVRRAEFAAGRWLAHRALSQLGISEAPLLPAGDRSPQWPSGVVGSISHTRRLCAVIAARTGDVVSLGLDLERDHGLDPQLWKRVLTSRELEWLAAQEEEARTRLALVVFCAKECFYKCQHPVTGRFLEFHDVELDLDPEARRFVARPVIDVGLSARFRFEGRWGSAQGHLVAALALRCPEETPHG